MSKERSGLTRREFVQLAGSVAAVGLVGQACGDESFPSELVQPPTRRSVDGELKTRFDVAFARNVVGGQYGGQNIYTRCYEGMVPGPTLRLGARDVLNLQIRNQLPANTDPPPVNIFMPHEINSTNFHTHGLHVSPSGNSDNVLISIDPGEVYDVRIEIPANHPGGTFWYHPHKHGAVTTQFEGGMAGALIIEGAIDEVPAIRAAREVILVFQELRLNTSGEVEDPDTTATSPSEVYPHDQILLTVNGQLNPTLRARPGEVLRLRCVNATIGTPYPLALDDHDLYVVAFDGISLSETNVVSSTFTSPGNRVDVLIRAGAPGTYALRGLEWARSATLVRDEVELLTLVVEGEPVEMDLPTELPAPYASIPDSELTGSRTVVYDTVDNTGQFPSGYTVGVAFVIDGKLFDANRVDQLVTLGAVEEWTIENPATEDHVFHIHTNPFEVVAIDGNRLDVPVWRDTFGIPRNGGSFTFRTRFLDFTGKMVNHCHILDHEDVGMMQLVEIQA